MIGNCNKITDRFHFIFSLSLFLHIELSELNFLFANSDDFNFFFGFCINYSPIESVESKLHLIFHSVTYHQWCTLLNCCTWKIIGKSFKNHSYDPYYSQVMNQLSDGKYHGSVYSIAFTNRIVVSHHFHHDYLIVSLALADDSAIRRCIQVRVAESENIALDGNWLCHLTQHPRILGSKTRWSRHEEVRITY